jgi:hypothetical protein
MRLYTVTHYYESTIDFQIEAENETQAENIAFSLLQNYVNAEGIPEGGFVQTTIEEVAL